MAATELPQAGSTALDAVAATVRKELLIESAYLVLDDATLEGVAWLHSQGIRVRALTNSLGLERRDPQPRSLRAAARAHRSQAAWNCTNCAPTRHPAANWS